MQTVGRQNQVFHALGDPTRRAVYQELIASEETVCALTARFSVSQPAISQHLRTLREAGLVEVRRQGRQAHYRAGPQGLKPLLEWMACYEKFWRSRDAALKAALGALDT
jgi:DNA-binding transcriptional ArsR family regulator